MKKIVLVGAGGHGLACLDVVLATKMYEVVGYVDQQESNSAIWKSFTYLGNDEQAGEAVRNVGNVLIGVGQIKSAKMRMNLVSRYQNLGVNFPTIVSPTAYVSPLSKIAEGTIVMHKSYVGPGADIGAHCILNTNSNIDHGASVGNFSHISTSSVVNGDVRIGNECFIGSNSTLCHGISVPDESFVQANLFIGRKHEWA